MAKPLKPKSARAVALDLLQAVLHGKKPLDQSIADHPALAALAQRCNELPAFADTVFKPG